MNRSIKFRFFMGNYSNPKYEYWDNLIKIGGGKLVGDYLLTTNPLIIIEQYTGLKDKNGIDIYEGDIVKGTLYLIAPFYNEIFSISYSGDDKGYGHHWDAHEVEVIGNIHENADLLND